MTEGFLKANEKPDEERPVDVTLIPTVQLHDVQTQDSCIMDKNSDPALGPEQSTDKTTEFCAEVTTRKVDDAENHTLSRNKYNQKALLSDSIQIILRSV